MSSDHAENKNRNIQYTDAAAAFTLVGCFDWCFSYLMLQYQVAAHVITLNLCPPLTQTSLGMPLPICVIFPGLRANRVDYLKFIVIRMSEWLLEKHPADQNAAAVVLTESRMRTHIAPLLAFLHWLSRKPRKGLKIILLSYKVLRGRPPSYLEEPIAPDHPNRPLRSQSTAVLVAPRIFKSRLGGRL